MTIPDPKFEYKTILSLVAVLAYKNAASVNRAAEAEANLANMQTEINQMRASMQANPNNNINGDGGRSQSAYVPNYEGIPFNYNNMNWNGCTSMYISLPIRCNQQTLCNSLILYAFASSSPKLACLCFQRSVSVVSLCSSACLRPISTASLSPHPKANTHRIANKSEDIFSVV